ncbi:MAG TPA: hypothetical protein VKQ72_17955, partial [Aggregatilineales bacterium]|nr:hypothetical protein [Aggregatilineales bacterium]
IRKLALMTALAFAALVINPNTVQMWTYSFRTIGIGVLQQYIQEWASPDIHGRETWPFVFMLLGLIAAVGLGSKRIDWTDLVLTCGWGFLALYAGRNISSFAVVAAPVLARHLDALLKERGMFLARSRPPRGVFLVLNWTLLLGVVLGASIKIALTLAPGVVAKAQNDYLPIQAAAYLNQAAPAGPMFNSYNWGGYLMFAAPQYPVFVDGRTDLYDDVLLTQWRDAEVGHDWQQTFAQWNIRLAVIEKDSPLAGALRQDSGWKQVHTDNLSAIFERLPS